MRLHVLDSTDPGAVLEVERAVDLDKTLFIVSSKSGGTIETLSHMRYFFERAGRDGSHFVAVTDPGSPLVELAHERGFRHVFENDPEIGGRYSVLSYFGLVPAALAGVNIEAMLHRAQVAEQNCARLRDRRRQLRPLAGRRDGRSWRCSGATRPPSWSPSRSRASASGSSS